MRGRAWKGRFFMENSSEENKNGNTLDQK